MPLYGAFLLSVLAVGLTRTGKVIEATAVQAADPKAPVVVLVGDAGREGLSRARFHTYTIATLNPDGAPLIFPPTGVAYKDNPESHYLWRWIEARAPDLILVAGEDYGLVAALEAKGIPARKVEPGAGVLRSLSRPPRSAAARELASRLARTPLEVARELEPHYGHAFEQAVYIPAVALIARMRLGHVDDVQKIVSPFMTGAKDSLVKPTGSHLPGHLVFAALAERTGDRRCVELVRKAAEVAASTPLHNEMSDAVFMACPILAKAGKLTGERRYFDLALEHLRLMQKLCLRSDGLYRHSPLVEVAWGRGNAFPALGLALALGDMPRDHPGFAEMRESLRKHLAVLARYQDENGMWRQVIDVPGVYREFSATAMIGTAMLRAVRRGWIEERVYRPRVDAAWRGVLARTRGGRVMDVCESTGKLKSLQEYLDRRAIDGEDARGGAMALLFATEMAGLEERERR